MIGVEGNGRDERMWKRREDVEGKRREEKGRGEENGGD